MAINTTENSDIDYESSSYRNSDSDSGFNHKSAEE